VLRVAFLEERLIVDFSEELSRNRGGIIDIHDQRFARDAAQGLPDDGGEFAIGEKDLGFAVLEDETDGFRVE
jgi:hypothetical protein